MAARNNQGGFSAFSKHLEGFKMYVLDVRHCITERKALLLTQSSEFTFESEAMLTPLCSNRADPERVDSIRGREKTTEELNSMLTPQTPDIIP